MEKHSASIPGPATSSGTASKNGLNHTPYTSYILRLWHAPHNGAWRATLKGVADNTQLHFTSMQTLIDFLSAQPQQEGDQA